MDDGFLPVTIQIAPFDDDPASMEAMIDSLGREVDCFEGPCDSLTWRERYSILPLKPVACCVAVPRKHRPSKKEALRWEGLDGETLLVKRGDSPVLNRMRDEIEAKPPESPFWTRSTSMTPTCSTSANRWAVLWKPWTSGKMSTPPS